MPLAGLLGGKNFEFLDVRRGGEEVGSLLHEGSGDFSGEMGSAARVVGKGIENAEGRGAKLDGVPGKCAGFLIDEGQCALKKTGDLLFLAGLGLERGEKREMSGSLCCLWCRHGNPPTGGMREKPRGFLIFRIINKNLMVTRRLWPWRSRSFRHKWQGLGRP